MVIHFFANLLQHFGGVLLHLIYQVFCILEALLFFLDIDKIRSEDDFLHRYRWELLQTLIG